MAPSVAELPYPTIVAFERVLVAIGDLGPEQRVDRAFLARKGFPRNAVAPILDALRFLDLVDGRGLATPALAAFRRDPARVCRDALARVVPQLRPPYPDRRHLAAALEGLAGRWDTTLLLKATFLAWLAERAGTDLIVRSRRKPGARAGVPKARHAPVIAAPDPPSGPRPAPAARPPAADAARTTRATAAVALTFQVVVDRNTSREDIDRMMREVEAAMARLDRGA